MSAYRTRWDPTPLKWDNTGVVVDVRQFEQYVIRVYGSGRVTLQNRKFLRQYVPVYPRHPPLVMDSDFGTTRPCTRWPVLHPDLGALPRPTEQPGDPTSGPVTALPLVPPLTCLDTPATSQPGPFRPLPGQLQRPLPLLLKRSMARLVVFFTHRWLFLSLRLSTRSCCRSHP